MSSPFSIFRRHQRTLMVVITGLSMISFVLLGAVQDPRNVPTPLIIIFLAAMAGGIAWLAGLSRGKGSEWGLTGAVVGAVIGLGLAFYSREAAAVLIDNGNLTSNDVSRLRRQRYLANRFIQLAFQQTFGIGLQALPPQMQRQYLFGFAPGNDDVSVQDVVLGELLRREADRMGIVVSKKIVRDFISQVSSKQGLMQNFDRVRGQMGPQEAAMYGFYLAQLKEKPLTAEAFINIRKQLQVSEAELLSALEAELKSDQAYQLLSGNNYFPPEQFWEFYRQLNVSQTAEIASIPVKDFMDLDAEPSESDLAAIFNEYRENQPGFTRDGQPAPGRPGFVQPRRIQLGYLEAVYDQLEPLVGDVTEEEIQKAYDEKYKKKDVPEGEMPSGEAGTEEDGPVLPPVTPSPDKPEMPAKPSAEQTPETPEDSDTEKPARAPDMPPVSEGKADSTSDQSAGESKKPAAEPSAPTKPEASSEEAPKEEPKEEPSEESSSNSDEGTSSVMPARKTQPVAFLENEESTTEEKPAEEASKPESASEEEKPAADSSGPANDAGKPDTPAPELPAPGKPAAETKPGDEKTDGDKPADEKPDVEKKADPTPPAPTSDPVPAAPASEIPPLTDALKEELKRGIIRQRTLDLIQERIEAAQGYLSSISDKVRLPVDDPDHMTLEAATEELNSYAGRNNLIYVVAPPLSYEEMAESEDYPVGRALVGQRMMVADAVFRTAPTDLYRVNVASDFRTSSGFAFWKLADKAAFIPQTMDDDEGIRAQVLKAWQLLEARPKAKDRAEALAKKIRESEKPMGEVLADETVTGDTNSLFIPVRVTGEFTWMQKPIVPPTGMQQPQTVRPSVIPGVDGAGEEFFQTVFNELNVGDVGIAPNEDHTEFYVVKILSRNPSTEEELDELRKKFLEQGLQENYSSLIQQKLSQNSVNWLQQLFTDHGVQIQIEE